ncbi:hypothetical protein HAX54_040775 [Datura stramonium]|uniref:Pentatricopeptide repeat-containing protein n=1 Tax=Datura stramonium TaxID=4076 RepID=A0ABS8RQ26_DATST|nr:hypothetical protein [Datura stramonium]
MSTAPEDKLRRFLQQLQGKTAIEKALTSVDVELTVDLVARGELVKLMMPLKFRGLEGKRLCPVYKKARQAGCRISLTAYKLLLMRLSRFGKCGMLLNIWNEMQESGYSSDMQVYEHVINGLCNIGQLENAVCEIAYRLFLKIKIARGKQNSQTYWRAKEGGISSLQSAGSATVSAFRVWNMTTIKDQPFTILSCLAIRLNLLFALASTALYRRVIFEKLCEAEGTEVLFCIIMEGNMKTFLKHGGLKRYFLCLKLFCGNGNECILTSVVATKEIAWMQEVLAVEPSFRNGLPSICRQCVANEINIAVRTAEKNYNEYMFREALRTGFMIFRAARDEYRLSCGSGGMNRNMLW